MEKLCINCQHYKVLNIGDPGWKVNDLNRCIVNAENDLVTGEQIDYSAREMRYGRPLNTKGACGLNGSLFVQRLGNPG